MLTVGSNVRLHQLASEKGVALNDAVGQVHSWDTKLGRWKVRVDGKLVALHAHNLLLVEDVKQEATGLPPEGASPGKRSRSPHRGGRGRGGGNQGVQCHPPDA